MKSKSCLLLIFIIMSFLFTQCKSVEFTFLGSINKKYSKKIENSDTVATTKTNLDLYINPFMEISGIITDVANNPISNADIYIIREDQMVAYSYSNENGQYSIISFFQPDSIDTLLQTDTVIHKFIHKFESDTTLSNNYKISVSANGFKSEEKDIAISSNDSNQINFVLKKLCSVSGIVTMNDKNPVPNALVILKKAEKELSVVETNQNGEFLFEQIEDGTYVISVLHNKYAFATKTIELHNGFDYKGIELVSSAGEISGVIKTIESNSPVPKAIITLQNMDINNYTIGQPFQISDTSDANGNYKIKGLNIGEYKMQVTASGYGSLIKEVELSDSLLQKQQDFSLSPEGIVSGQLTNYNAKDTIIFIVIDNDKNFYETNNIDINNDGKYAIKGIPKGIYTVVLKWKNMLISKDSIHVLPAKETPEINFILEEATGYISGRVISQNNNEPIENALIIAFSDNSGNYAFSDKYGRYKIPGLSSGTYGILVNSFNYEIANQLNLLLENNKVLENINFNLTRQKSK